MVKRVRLRWCLKWLGAGACLIIAVAFAVSSRRAVDWTSSGLDRQIGLYLGEISYGWRPETWRLEDDPYAGSPGGGIAKYGGSPSLRWWIERSALPTWEGIAIPLWMPFAVVAVPTAVLWHRDRRFTREALHRWKERSCPRRPKRMTFGLVLVWYVIHFVAAIPFLIGLQAGYNFFVVPINVTYASRSATQILLDRVFFD